MGGVFGSSGRQTPPLSFRYCISWIFRLFLVTEAPTTVTQHRWGRPAALLTGETPSEGRNLIKVAQEQLQLGILPQPATLDPNFGDQMFQATESSFLFEQLELLLTASGSDFCQWLSVINIDWTSRVPQSNRQPPAFTCQSQNVKTLLYCKYLTVCHGHRANFSDTELQKS